MIQNVYNRLLRTTTVVDFPNKKSEHGTGFFYNYNGSTFLITNRHVLEHEENQPEKVSIYFRDYSSIENINRIDITLYEDHFPRWLIHPDFPEADLTALPLNQNLSHVNDSDHKTGSLALSAETFADPDLLIRGGTGARVFGYPQGYVDKNSKFPIARSGLIASPYGYWFDDSPQFLLDGSMGDGMSGSPVFTDRTTEFERLDGNSHMAGSTTFFIGVHAAEYRTPANPQDTDSNINHIWYSELIESLLSINGLCDFVDSVSFERDSDFLDNGLDIDYLSEFVTKTTTWEMFDPECNKPDSPSEAVNNTIEPDTILELVSNLEESATSVTKEEN
ncbi:serine protease [Salinibaculum salinum]|uniref:S1 family peptidase n=1 Tax=Salinibaculum salinum TaxID=3131996 RepID=UPI0030EBC178